jgi:biotin synthase
MYKDLLNACERGENLTPELAIQVLDDALPAEVWQQVRRAADRRMRSIGDNRGKLYASIGVDAVPCSMNCKFCSHGAAWGLANATWELSVDEVCARVDAFLAQGTPPDWFTLRTTQHYGIDRLETLCRAVRAYLPAETELIVNTGEFTLSEAQRLADVGVNGCYHTYRLREGCDTGVSPSERLKTLGIIRRSPLKLVALVEPLGPEHTDAEIVETAFLLKIYGVSLSGCMVRVPVPGTPLACHGAVSEERQIRVIALTRLISGAEVKDICVHLPSGAALESGANTVVVESGGIPRDTGMEKETWQHFGIADAFDLLEAHGFQTSRNNKEEK